MEPPSGDATGRLLRPGSGLEPNWHKADEAEWGESPLKAALPVLKEMDEQAERLREMTRQALGIEPDPETPNA